jgi:predicted metal-binding membrane protein
VSSRIREQGSRAAVALRWRPEWWVAAGAGVAWIVLAAGVHSHGAPDLGAAAAGAMGGHDMAAMGGHEHASAGVLAGLPDWTLMSVAMMAPAALPAVRHVGLNSIRRRRQWAMALYFAVFVAVWVAFGVAALLAARAGRDSVLGADGVLVAALAVAAAWQLGRPKRRALFRCRRTVALPPAGLRADVGCARFALVQSWRCMKSCWALMVVMAVVGHAGLVWMAALTALIALEELTLLGRRLLRPSAAILALAAVLVAAGV